jgi:hypothetical protein
LPKQIQLILTQKVILNWRFFYFILGYNLISTFHPCVVAIINFTIAHSEALGKDIINASACVQSETVFDKLEKGILEPSTPIHPQFQFLSLVLSPNINEWFAKQLKNVNIFPERIAVVNQLVFGPGCPKGNSKG